MFLGGGGQEKKLGFSALAQTSYGWNEGAAWAVLCVYVPCFLMKEIFFPTAIIITLYISLSKSAPALK